jgi:hypothetical protein
MTRRSLHRPRTGSGPLASACLKLLPAALLTPGLPTQQMKAASAQATNRRSACPILNRPASHGRFAAVAWRHQLTQGTTTRLLLPAPPYTGAAVLAVTPSSRLHDTPQRHPVSPISTGSHAGRQPLAACVPAHPASLHRVPTHSYHPHHNLAFPKRPQVNRLALSAAHAANSLPAASGRLHGARAGPRKAGRRGVQPCLAARRVEAGLYFQDSSAALRSPAAAALGSQPLEAASAEATYIQRLEVRAPCCTGRPRGQRHGLLGHGPNAVGCACHARAACSRQHVAAQQLPGTACGRHTA